MSHHRHRQQHNNTDSRLVDPETAEIIRYLPHVVRDLQFESQDGTRFRVSHELIASVDGVVTQYLKTRDGAEERGRKK